jgi:hypothetical protein
MSTVGCDVLSRADSVAGKAAPVLARNPPIGQSREAGSQHRRNPEEPQLRERPAPTKTAVPMLRAGFTEVLVTGMLMRWIRVKPSPIKAESVFIAPDVEDAAGRSSECAERSRPERCTQRGAWVDCRPRPVVTERQLTADVVLSLMSSAASASSSAVARSPGRTPRWRRRHRLALTPCPNRRWRRRRSTVDGTRGPRARGRRSRLGARGGRRQRPRGSWRSRPDRRRGRSRGTVGYPTVASQA